MNKAPSCVNCIYRNGCMYKCTHAHTWRWCDLATDLEVCMAGAQRWTDHPLQRGMRCWEKALFICSLKDAKCCTACVGRAPISKENCLTASSYLVTRLHLTHTIVVRLHVHKTDIVILTPKMAGSFSVRRYDFLSRRKPRMFSGFKWDWEREQGAYGTPT